MASERGPPPLLLLDVPGNDVPRLIVDPVSKKLKTEAGQALMLRFPSWQSLPSGLDFRAWDKESNAVAAAVAPQANVAAGKAYVSLSGEALEAMTRFEEAVRTAVASARPGKQWTRVVRTAERQQTAAGFNVKINLAGRAYTGAKPTRLKLCDATEDVFEGFGWHFLEPHAQVCDHFKQGSCLLLLEPSLWEMEHATGVTLNAVQLWLKPSPSILHSPLACCEFSF